MTLTFLYLWKQRDLSLLSVLVEHDIVNLFDYILDCFYPPPPPPLHLSLLTNDIQHVIRSQIKEAGTRRRITNMMAGISTKTIAEELMDAINYHHMRAHPAYISEADAVDIGDFTRSTLAQRYVLDTVNLYWPGKVNSNHVFEIFSEFLEHEDAGKTRCDMVEFVKSNKDRYFMDGHTVLKMHETDLDTWSNSMVYSNDMADELAIYALSDLTRKHTTIITNTKPWTTVHPDVTVENNYQLLEMCDVKLLFLGNRKFGRLRQRPKDCNNPIVTNPPVFPGNEPPGIRELETAKSLLMMQNQRPTPG